MVFDPTATPPFGGSGASSAGSSTYDAPQAFTSDPAWFVPPGDYDTIRDLAGVSSAAWPNTRVQEMPFLPTALAEARRRFPCDWEALSVDSRQWLRLGLGYTAAALIVAAANPDRTETFKIGDFSLKTDDATLLADQSELLGYAASYYANVVLPSGAIALPVQDAFPRPMIRKASVCGVGPGRLY